MADRDFELQARPDEAVVVPSDVEQLDDSENLDEVEELDDVQEPDDAQTDDAQEPHDAQADDAQADDAQADDAQEPHDAQDLDDAQADDAARSIAGVLPPPEREPEPEAGQVAATGRSRLRAAMNPRVSRGQLLAGLLCLVLGFALVASVRQTRSDDYASLRQSDLVRILTGLNEESARLEEESRRLQGIRDDLASGSDSSAAAEQAARERLEVLGVLTGTAPATGPGIELDIRDPEVMVTAATLLDTLQELRDAGAEAVQLDDVRVVASTSFVDAEGGVRVDGALLTPPYRYKAIGDPPTMAAALDIPGGVLEVLRQEGATGTVSDKDEITIDALRPLSAPEYARPAPAPSP